MISPTIGMLVDFQPTQFHGDPRPPTLDAVITAVTDERTVDLLITAGNGTEYEQANVRLLQLADPALTWDGHDDVAAPLHARMRA
jgi:hypothetical protein